MPKARKLPTFLPSIPNGVPRRYAIVATKQGYPIEFRTPYAEFESYVLQGNVKVTIRNGNLCLRAPRDLIPVGTYVT